MKKTSTPQNHLVEIVTPEIQNARVDNIQGRNGAYRAIVKTKGGLKIVDDLGFERWNKPQWTHSLDVFTNFKKGALQTIEFKPEGSDYWFKVFARSGNKITTIDSDMLAAMKVGHINQDWSNSTLYSQTQYKAVKATNWESYAFVKNK